MNKDKNKSLNPSGGFFKHSNFAPGIMMLAIFILAGCTQQNIARIAPTADIVYTNAKVYTVNEAQPWAEAVAVEGNKIIFVGTSSDAKKHIGEKTRVINLNGKMLLPGFVEGHIHPISGALATVGVDLQYDSIEEVLDTLKKYADANPNLEIIRGFGWRYPLFPSTGPTKEQLDKIISNRPVYLIAIDGHSGWANSKALKMAGVTKETPDPQPGFSHYQRDPKTRKATGYLVEVPAMMEVLVKLQPQTKERVAKEFEKMLPQFPAAGIASIFDAGMLGVGEENGFQIYLDLEKREKLPMRVVGSFYHNKPDIDPLPILKKLKKAYYTDLVKANVLKINVDGGDAQYTGAFLQPYADKPETSGEPIFTSEQLNKLVVAADAAGFDCHFHAYGDRAVRMALDAVEAASKTNPKRDRRHTLGHVQYLQDDDVSRFAELNAIAQMSVQWAMPDATIVGVSGVRVGKEILYSEFSRPRSIIDAGGKVAFGTDWPAAGHYSTYKPLEAIEVAMTRKMLKDQIGVLDVLPPLDERLTLEQSLKSSTIIPAYQLHLDDKVGSIEVGKLADLVILEKNLFDVKPDQISQVKVLMTMMNGKVTYEDEHFK
jgi:predicted amidohydrolase YtcJ